jgi:hypothetical protein
VGGCVAYEEEEEASGESKGQRGSADRHGLRDGRARGVPRGIRLGGPVTFGGA